MVQTCSRTLALACLAAVAAAPAASSAQDLPDRGRELTETLVTGDLASLQPLFSPKFLQAIGGAAGLATLREKLKSTAGRKLELLEESAFHESGYTSYYGIWRFEKVPSLMIRWIWAGDGTVISVAAAPTPSPAQTPHLSYRSRATLHLPMLQPEQGAWYVAWGGRGSIENKHAQAADQRFAYDFLVMQGRQHFRGDGTKNEDHFCFGEPVVAPAEGRVVTATDGEADNPRPGVHANKSAAGNHVIIDHGFGEHSLIAHLRLGSVAVKPGQQVASGQMLGACGNSGKSDLPHIHYHLQTGSTYGEGLGLPAAFQGYFLGGRLIRSGEPVRGDYLLPARTRQSISTAENGAVEK